MITGSVILAEAIELADTALTEIRRRTAISRAYYAAHHVAKQVAFRQGFVDERKRSVHTELIRFLSLRPEKICFEVATSLEKLRNWRNHADYDLVDSISRDVLDDALFYADEIINELIPAVANGNANDG